MTNMHTFARLRRTLALLLPLALGIGAAHAADTVTYYHTDALGTPVMESNATGTVTYTREHRAYGEQALGTAKPGPGFTGHIGDAETGLIYMQQRYYDPVIGRFLAVDPVSTDIIGGANFNRYWYANNNPYRFNDPDGRMPVGNTRTKNSQEDDEKEREREEREKKEEKKREEARQRQQQLLELAKAVNDGHLTLDEARAWYHQGNGVPVTVDQGRLTVMYVRYKDGTYRAWVTGADHLVHGQVSLNFKTMRIYDAPYDFEMHPNNSATDVARNFVNIFGRLYNGKGTPFEIRYRGGNPTVQNSTRPTLPKLPSH